MRTLRFILLFALANLTAAAQIINFERKSDRIYLDSKDGHNGNFTWLMKKSSEVTEKAETVSTTDFSPAGWMSAIVPGTVLNSLVYNKVYPEPYYSDNNLKTKGLIPDLYDTGRDFYTYWFRTEFDIPESYRDQLVWLQVDGINYRAEVWVNGHLLSTIGGMFVQDYIDITEFAKIGAKNALAIRVYPVDMPGTLMRREWGAGQEFHNGGDGNIGLNTTMLMSVGWDFTFYDGVRDRNTGIWRSISLYPTGKMLLRHPFVKSELSHPNYDVAKETVSVEVFNPTTTPLVHCTVEGEIVGENIRFSKEVDVERGVSKEIIFTPEEFSQLTIKNPRLWWPHNKGGQPLYELKMTVSVDGKTTHTTSTKFGIREIKTDRNTPDQSRTFYVNGKQIFIRGTNWIPEAMLRTDDHRMYAEMRYTKQMGLNFIRLWGGGIAESDYFYQLCDEMGFLVWQEFWLTGDTKHPQDKGLYFNNVVSTVKRIRNHPCIAYYVASNESSEVFGTKELLNQLDGTRSYQMQSECDGIHDGSPYRPVNPMLHYENKASDRGSRIDGFNPEYGTTTMPTYEVITETMDENDLFPMNKNIWKYQNGNEFYLMTTLNDEMIRLYGTPKNLEDYTMKAQLLGALSAKAIWETWNINKLNYGDRFTSGLLFWKHQCPIPQILAQSWDYSLEPTAMQYHTANALEPLHAQFDYLKNTVSVSNDYPYGFDGYKVRADVYDLNSKKILSETKPFNIKAEEVLNDIIRINFPATITPVHFVRLAIIDNKGNETASTFYWRSTDEYKGKGTLTGPCTGGFDALESMPHAKLKIKNTSVVKDGFHKTTVTLTNTSGNIAFFTQIILTDANGKPVRPSFYTDNFFSLLPGEKKTVEIETLTGDMPTAPQLTVKGRNLQTVKLKGIN